MTAIVEPISLPVVSEGCASFGSRAASAPICAAASMPNARPDTTVRPDADSVCAKRSAFCMPCTVALRLPTMASAGRDNNAMRPFAYSSGGGSVILSRDFG